jgi:hypothetical protein
MRIRSRRFALYASIAVATLAVPLGFAVGNASAATDPTAGFTRYNANYKVQNWTHAPLNQRFTITNGVFNINVHSGERRVEMAWDRWANQGRAHMWSADVLIDPGSTRTAIMQIKSNSSGEPIYVQVYDTNGDLRNDGGGQIARNMYGRWFHMNCSFDPATGVGQIWIDGTLVYTRTYRKGGGGWYFKNGAYNNGLPAGARTSVHFRNIELWTK